MPISLVMKKFNLFAIDKLSFFLIGIIFSASQVSAQRTTPNANCLVSEFRSIALLTHDIEQRIIKINDWIKLNGASCTPSQLSAIASNRANWLGTADTVAISSSIDGLIEAKIKNEPDLMAQMYSSSHLHRLRKHRKHQHRLYHHQPTHQVLEVLGLRHRSSFKWTPTRPKTV
jgi:hypothetical protein